MSKIEEIIPMYIDTIPRKPKEGILYISKEFGVAVHLCACGCGGKTVTPLDEWALTEKEEGIVSLTPSIGNWSGEKPYHAHYYITNNKIIWC